MVGYEENLLKNENCDEKEIDFKKIDGLRLEAKQKLSDIRPMNIGQASRISGVSPADVSVLLVYLQAYNRDNEPTMDSY